MGTQKHFVSIGMHGLKCILPLCILCIHVYPSKLGAEGADAWEPKKNSCQWVCMVSSASKSASCIPSELDLKDFCLCVYYAYMYTPQS